MQLKLLQHKVIRERQSRGQILTLSCPFSKSGGFVYIRCFSDVSHSGNTLCFLNGCGWLTVGYFWQIVASNLTFDAVGDAIVSNSASADQVYFKIEEGESTVVDPAPTELTIEAEAFDSTGGSGTYVNYSAYGGDDAVGVMSYTTTGGTGAINFVQLDDYAEYLDIEVAAGVYQVEYFTGTTVADSQISLQIDGSTVASDSVVNNGDWDTFVSLVSNTQVEISAGTHTLRVVGTGASEWQWNLDRIELTRVGDLP